MPPKSRCASAAVAVLGFVACNSDFGNPFANAGAIVPPGPAASLLYVSNGYAQNPLGMPREVFAIADTGTGLSQVTACSTASKPCDTPEIAPAPDRRRMVARRILADSNGDGVLSPSDNAALYLVDFARGIEGQLLPATRRITGIDWSPAEDLIAYSALSLDGNLDDLHRIDTSAQNDGALTLTPAVRERYPRIDPSGSVLAFERMEGASGKSQIAIFVNSGNITPVTTGGPGTERLAGSDYVVGSDSCPDYSPDGKSLVFRRLTGITNGGTWDIVTVRIDGSGPATVVSGAVHRSPPDWGPAGIAFVETDVANGTSALVLVQPDGSGRKSLVTLGANYDMRSPRFLAALR